MKRLLNAVIPVRIVSLSLSRRAIDGYNIFPVKGKFKFSGPFFIKDAK